MRGAIAKIGCATVVMGLFCMLITLLVPGFGLADRLNAAIIVGVCVPGGVALYVALLYVLQFEELATLATLARQRLDTARQATGAK